MNVVHLSPHFPTHYSLFTRHLVGYGARVFGVTDRPDEALSWELRQYLTCHYRVDRLHDTGQVLQACRHFRDGWGRLDHVESHLEPWIELEAAVREAFDIPGPRPGDLAFIKRKSLMKQVFARAQVPTARGALVENLAQCREFIGGKFPAFIKPDSGVGAGDTYTINTDDDLRSFFSGRGPYPYFIEEYLDGIIESFDGLTDRDGNIVFWTSHLFNNDIHKIVKLNQNLAYYNVRTVPGDLESMGRRVVEAARIRGKFFHIEFYRLADGQLRGLEINMRPPGGLTTHMFNYSADIDVYDWWAAIVVQGRREFHFDRTYHCAYVGRKLDRAYRYTEEELRRRFGARIVHAQAMNPIEYAVMGQYAFLVRSSSEDEVRDMIAAIQEEMP